MAPKTRLESAARPSLARDQYMETQVIAKKEWYKKNTVDSSCTRKSTFNAMKMASESAEERRYMSR